MPAAFASVVVLALIVVATLLLVGRRQSREARRITERLQQVDRRIRRANQERHDDFLAQKDSLGNVARDTAARLARIEKDVVDLRRTSGTSPQPITVADMTSAGTAALAGIVFDGTRPRVNLVLQNFVAGNVFAGIRTAVVAAAELAARLDLPLHLLVFEPTPEPRDEVLASVRSLLDDIGHPQLAEGLTLSLDGAREPGGHHADDVWIATFWPTAWNLARLAEQGHIRVDRTVYLVQDWEPSFYPAGDLQAKALSTYDAGFLMVINSAPLARYVSDNSTAFVNPAAVFGPEIETDRLAEVARRFRPAPAGEVRLLLYARPSKPRNMLTLGLQAVRAWADLLPASVTPIVHLAGENIGDVDLGDRIQVVVHGKTTLSAYYELLASTDVGLALMYSAHPGHLALELPLAGIPTVTNSFGTYREPWVSGLTVADTSANALAQALVDLTVQRQTHEPGEFLLHLGPSMTTAIGDLAERLL